MKSKAIQVVSSVGRWMSQLANVQVPSAVVYGVRIR